MRVLVVVHITEKWTTGVQGSEAGWTIDNEAAISPLEEGQATGGQLTISRTTHCVREHILSVVGAWCSWGRLQSRNNMSNNFAMYHLLNINPHFH